MASSNVKEKVTIDNIVQKFKENQKIEDKKTFQYNRNLRDRIQQLQNNKNELPFFNIQKVNLSFASSEDIRRIAAVECKSFYINSTYGIDSPKLGSVSLQHECETCGFLRDLCPGHIGYIELAMPIFNPLALDYIKQLLQCICEGCGKLLLPSIKKDQFMNEISRVDVRLKEISKYVSKSQNSCCDNPIPKDFNEKKENYSYYAYGKQYENIFCFGVPKSKIEYEFLGESKRTLKFTVNLGTKKLTKLLYPLEVKRIFDRISLQDRKVLGFDKTAPGNMIMEVLPIIPPRNRPEIKVKNEIKKDNITIIYEKILKNNIEILSQLKGYKSTEKKEYSLQKTVENQWNDIVHLFNNKDGKLKFGTIKVRTFNDLLSGKDGYCRGLSQGKRANLTARTVIGPGFLPFNYIVLPDFFRKEFRTEEGVHELNITRLNEALMSGDINYLWKKKTSEKYYITPEFLKRAKDKIHLEHGDIVTRNMINDDEVMINRLPTLHRYSMIGTRTIFNGNKNTIQMHMSYTPGLNADFDGDQIDEIAVVRGDLWIIDTDGDRRLTGNDLQIQVPRESESSQPIVGDFNGDGKDEPGYYDNDAA